MRCIATFVHQTRQEHASTLSIPPMFVAAYSAARPMPLACLQSGMQNEGRAGVAVLLPAGRYKVTQFIELQQSNVAVRGEGVRGAAAAALLHPSNVQLPPMSIATWSATGCHLVRLHFSRLALPDALMTACPPRLQVDRTVLYFPKPLQHIYGNLMSWSFMGGFLT